MSGPYDAALMRRKRVRPQDRRSVEELEPLPELLPFHPEDGAEPLLVRCTPISWLRAKALNSDLGIVLRYRDAGERVHLQAVMEHPEGTAMHRITSSRDPQRLQEAASDLLWQVWRAAVKSPQRQRLLDERQQRSA